MYDIQCGGMRGGAGGGSAGVLCNCNTEGQVSEYVGIPTERHRADETAERRNGGSMTPEDKRDLCARYEYSDVYLAYWIEHSVCEACGKQESAMPHHIVSRGAGGRDDVANLLALCFVCHGQAYHTHGWRRFCLQFPHLADKIHARRLWEGEEP